MKRAPTRRGDRGMGVAGGAPLGLAHALAWLFVGAHATAGAAAAAAALATTVAKTAPTPTPPGASSALAWQPLADGAARASIGAGEPGTVVQLFRFDLSRFRPEVVIGAGKPPHPHTAAELVQQRGAVAAVNGGFFDERVVPLGLRISAGETRSSLRAKADWGVLTFTEDGRARIGHTREYVAAQTSAPAEGPENIRDAIQVGPRLIADGAPLKLKPQEARRTAVALDKQGRTVTLVIVDQPIDANDLAATLARHGFDTALMLDGGPSTQAAISVGKTKLEIAGAYPVPDLLAIFPMRPAARNITPTAPAAPSPIAPTKPRKPSAPPSLTHP